MRVIPPLSITDAILTLSTASEPDADEATYNAGTTYGIGAEVISTTTHRTYESLQAGNVGNALPVLPETVTAWWLDVGPTNRWAMFDLLRNTQTVRASPLTVVLTPGVLIDSIALLGLEATEVTVSMVSGVTTVYTHTEDLGDYDVGDWYEYFFGSFRRRESLVLFDLSAYSGGVLTVTITNADGDAACGACVIGSYVYIGQTVHEAESDELNFSKTDRDEFGNAAMIPRRSIPKVNKTVYTEKELVKTVYVLRKALNAVPAFYTSLDEASDDWFELFAILGFYRRWTINAAWPTHAIMSMEIEEL